MRKLDRRLSSPSPFLWSIWIGRNPVRKRCNVQPLNFPFSLIVPTAYQILPRRFADHDFGRTRGASSSEMVVNFPRVKGILIVGCNMIAIVFCGSFIAFLRRVGRVDCEPR